EGFLGLRLRRPEIGRRHVDRRRRPRAVAIGSLLGGRDGSLLLAASTATRPPTGPLLGRRLLLLPRLLCIRARLRQSRQLGLGCLLRLGLGPPARGCAGGLLRLGLEGDLLARHDLVPERRVRDAVEDATNGRRNL